jgi:hypothetical protein
MAFGRRAPGEPGKHHTMPCHHGLAEALRAYRSFTCAQIRKGPLSLDGGRVLRGWTPPVYADRGEVLLYRRLFIVAL